MSGILVVIVFFVFVLGAKRIIMLVEFRGSDTHETDGQMRTFLKSMEDGGWELTYSELKTIDKEYEE